MISNATQNAVAPVAEDIRDIKPPIEISDGLAWLWWGLAALAIVTLAFLVWRWFNKRKANIVLPPPVPAHVRAKQKLEQALALITQPKPFVVAVSDTARAYLEERFQFHAPERTTEEFLRELGGTKLLLPEQKASLGEFLASCDLVKFAKYEPGETELRGLHASAVRMVEETEIEADSGPNLSGEPQFQNNLKPTESQIGKNHYGKTFAILGTAFQVAPVSWFLIYLSLLVKGFFRFIKNPTPDFGQVFSIYTNALLAVSICFAIGILGLILLLIALLKHRYRAEWFFWFLVLYGFMLFGIFPILGIIVGLFLIIYCLTNRREFLNRT